MKVLRLGPFVYEEAVEQSFMNAAYLTVADAKASPEKTRFSLKAVPIEVEYSYFLYFHYVFVCKD
jgi:hypothetical protein